MKIYFARHGESQANLLKVISNRTLPHHLTNRGREQAARLADRLEAHCIMRIFSSPLVRAVETSTIVAERRQVQVELADGLREYDCGIAEGRSDEVAWQLWQAEYDAWLFHHDYTYQIEGGESFQDVHRRFAELIDKLIEQYGTSTDAILCISHGGIYSVMFPLIMRNVKPDMIQQYGFDYTSLIVAEYRPNGLVCLEWNGTQVDND